MEICANEKTINRYISIEIKRAVLNRQGNRCSNNPYNPAINLSDYLCVLWKYEDGVFDNSGYQFDHINEFSKTGDNSIGNIQALCPMCHSVKTKKFLRNKKFFTSTELENGACLMEIE
jgi:hypothetical protein